jgi:hypothetical protein
VAIDHLFDYHRGMSIGLATIAKGIELLLGELSGADPAEALQILRGLETHTRRVAAVQHLAIGQLIHQLPADAAAGLGAVLATEPRITVPDARARVRAAQNMGPRWGLTGEPLPRYSVESRPRKPRGSSRRRRRSRSCTPSTTSPT